MSPKQALREIVPKSRARNSCFAIIFYYDASKGAGAIPLTKTDFMCSPIPQKNLSCV